MGNGCSNFMEMLGHLATTAELRKAVLSIEAWQKVQDQTRGTTGAHASGALLYRVGGPDVVKQVVEAFYRRLYANERLLVFLHDKDRVYLRAKQSSFMAWLFGPPNMPYGGKHLRIAHLRLIKQRGFSPEDFEVGMSCFADALREIGVPEAIVSEVMDKIRPFKDVIFTPTAKDAEESARWIAEERARLEQEAAKQAQQQLPPGRPAAGLLPSSPPAANLLAIGAPSNGTRPGSGVRMPQCPFTGARLSRPASAAAGAGAPGAPAAMVGPAPDLLGPLVEPPPLTGPQPAATSSSRPATGSVPAAVAAAPTPNVTATAAADGAAADAGPAAKTTAAGGSAPTASPPASRLSSTASAPAAAAAAAAASAAGDGTATAPQSAAPSSSSRPATAATAAATSDSAPAATGTAIAPADGMAPPLTKTASRVGAPLSKATSRVGAAPSKAASQVGRAPSKAESDIVGAFLNEVVASEKTQEREAAIGEEDEDVMAAALAELELAAGATGGSEAAASAVPAPAAAAAVPVGA